jgi:predicted metal-binding protein
MTKPTLMICLQCGSTERDANGQKLPNPVAVQLTADVQAILTANHPTAAHNLDVIMVRCFNLCPSPIAWGVRADDKTCHTFAPAPEAAHMASFAAQWLVSPQGNVPKADMHTDIKNTRKARIPALPAV